MIRIGPEDPADDAADSLALTRIGQGRCGLGVNRDENLNGASHANLLSTKHIGFRARRSTICRAAIAPGSIAPIHCLPGGLTGQTPSPMHRRSFPPSPGTPCAMRVRNSLRTAKARDKNCRVVRRRGRVYVINKKNPRMKARQG